MGILDDKIRQGQLVYEDTGTAVAAAIAATTFIVECTAFILKNLSSTQKLLYSIDGGTKFLTLEPLSEVEKERFVREILVKRAGNANVAYNIEWSERQ